MVRRIKVWGGAEDLRSECVLLIKHSDAKNLNDLKVRVAKKLKVSQFIESKMANQRKRMMPDYSNDFDMFFLDEKKMFVDTSKPVRRLADLKFGDVLALTWDKLLLSTAAWRCEACRQLNTNDDINCVACERANPLLRFGKKEDNMEVRDSLVYRWRCKGCFNPNSFGEEVGACPTCRVPRPSYVIPFTASELKEMDIAKKRKMAAGRNKMITRGGRYPPRPPSALRQHGFTPKSMPPARPIFSNWLAAES